MQDKHFQRIYTYVHRLHTWTEVNTGYTFTQNTHECMINIYTEYTFTHDKHIDYTEYTFTLYTETWGSEVNQQFQ